MAMGAWMDHEYERVGVRVVIYTAGTESGKPCHRSVRYVITFVFATPSTTSVRSLIRERRYPKTDETVRFESGGLVTARP